MINAERVLLCLRHLTLSTFALVLNLNLPFFLLHCFHTSCFQLTATVIVHAISAAHRIVALAHADP